MAQPQTFEIEGHTLAALEANPGKSEIPIVLIHGITSSIYFWTEGLSPIIRDNLHWFSLSLPGHQPAQFPPGFEREDMTAEMMARVMSGAVRHITGGRPALLMGHSTGGFSALAIAAAAPELAHSVICISGFARGRWTGALSPLQRFARWGCLGEALFLADLNLITSSYAIYYNSLRFYARDVKGLYAHPYADATIRTLYPEARKLDKRAMLPYFDRMPEIDITAWLPRIAAPTLVLAGDRDPIVPPAQARLIAEKVPGSKLVLLPGVGHLPMSERQVEYEEAIEAWIRQQGVV